MNILAHGVGRRKEAVAQVTIVDNKSTNTTNNYVIINNKPAQEYFRNKENLLKSVEKLKNFYIDSLTTNDSVCNVLNNFNICLYVKVKGGGLAGQTQAILLALAVAFSKSVLVLEQSIQNSTSKQHLDNESDLTVTVKKQLKEAGFLEKDSRVKERRKYGLKKARKRSPFNKR